MSGAAIIMELCRYFQVHRPRRTMEFVWFGAEEKGLLGSQNYIKVHETELPAHRFNMNVDLAGQLVGGTVVGVTGDASVCNMITYMAHEIGIGMSTKNQIWGSDSNTFAWKGIPAMTLNRDGFRHAHPPRYHCTAVRLVTGEKCHPAWIHCRQTGKYRQFSV